MKIAIPNGDYKATQAAWFEITGRQTSGKSFTVEITDGIEYTTRTTTQNSALHVFFRLLAEALNDAGYDMKRVIKPEVDIPWNERSVKEFLWKPIQHAVIDKDSTTRLDTKQVSQVYDVLNRHLAEKFGVSVPFPQRDVA